MTPPRSLASLPDIVLREILSYLLVDTPREPNRAAVLSTCSTLYELGIRSLYRVVDLTYSPPGGEQFCRHLMTLFCRDCGLLTNASRLPALGQAVTELRGTFPHLTRIPAGDLVCGQMNLVNCTLVVLHAGNYIPHRDDARPIIHDLLRQIPVDHLLLRNCIESQCRGVFGTTRTLSSMLGMRVQAWDRLRRVTMSGTLWLEHDDVVGWYLSLADWTFEELVLDLVGRTAQDSNWRWVFGRLLAPPPLKQVKKFFEAVKRIELRLDPEVEAAFRSELLKVREETPVDPRRERLVPLIVFVRSDGTEHPLIEPTE